jgi:hypothetical protein
MLGFLLLSACATTPLFEGELHEGQQRVSTMTPMPKRASSPARLERHYCPEAMSTEQKLDCADFHDLARNVRDAASLWVQVARDAEHPEQQCFAVHRLSVRASEALERVAPVTVARCETQQAERLSACTSSCTSEVPECQGRQRAFVAATLAAQLLAYDWLWPEERFIPGLPLDENLMRMPGFPACGREFTSCVAMCAMPRRVASR